MSLKDSVQVGPEMPDAGATLEQTTPKAQRNPRSSKAVSDGPNVKVDGVTGRTQYLPAAYKTRSGNIRQDR